MKFPTEKHLQELKGDRFGYKSLSKKILDEILLEMELPNTLGIYGNWGSGKTTLLHFIKKHIEEGAEEKYKKIIPVYFESWKYEYSDQNDLLFALLGCIKTQTKINGKKWKSLMIDAIAISFGVLRNIGVEPQATIKDIEKIEGKVCREHERWIDKVETFRQDFKKIVENVLEKKKATKLIIFIDDLDRCLPENTVKLLEGIKNFLSVENTLFTLAIDRRIISEMIEKKYGLHDGYGGEYLMKIIHYYYELPIVSLDNIISEILLGYEIELATQEKSYIVQFLKSEAGEPRVAKHIIHQLGMNIVFSKDIRNTLNDNTDKEFLLYVFVASFLLTKFPKVFSTCDSSQLLKNIRHSAGIKVKGDDSRDEYRKLIESQSIDLKTRNKIESVMIRYPINLRDSSESNKLINDMDKLSMIMKKIRTHC